MELPNRKRIRLEDYDYSQNGAYYITICTRDKEKILSEITEPAEPGDNPAVVLSPTGKIVDQVLRGLPGIDIYVIMPNHIHFIFFNEKQGQLASVIRIFKANVTRKIGTNIWQTRYYDHVIRDEADYLTKWKYIDDNPAKWKMIEDDM